MSTLLYPRLARERARPLLQGIRDRDPETLLATPRFLLEGHTFAPIGGRQVTEEELSSLRENAIEIARNCGFPDRRDEAGRIRFDRLIAHLLHEQMGITPHQAADEEIWTHLSVGPLAALAAWRFSAPPDDRLLGRAPRNTFRRLWWRSETLGPLAWDEEGLREDETVQIMERTGMSASPIVARAAAEAFHRRLTAGHRGGRMDLMRDALKRVNRLTPFLRMEALPPNALRELLDELFADAAAAIGGGAVVAPVESARTDDLAGTDQYLTEPVEMVTRLSLDHAPGAELETEATWKSLGGGVADTGMTRSGISNYNRDATEAGQPSFEDVPLGLIMQRLCEAVRSAGSIDDRRLSTALAETGGFSIPARRKRLIGKLAWSAKGRGYLEFDEDRGGWNPGIKSPEFDNRFGSWSYSDIAKRASEMLTSDPDPFEPLLFEVAERDRPPRIIASVVGTALNEAKGARKTARR